MKVSRMIKELQKMDPNAEVKLHTLGGESVLFVLTLLNDKSEVWLESESDVDLKSELETRFTALNEKQISDSELYTDLLEIGIGVDLVERYMGEEIANKMKEFYNANEPLKEE